MKGKTSAKLHSFGKKRRGKGDAEFVEEIKDDSAESSLEKKEKFVPCFKKKKRTEIIKETSKNKDSVVSDSSQQKCTAEGNIAGTKVDEMDQEHKDRKDIMIDYVNNTHGMILSEMQEKENSDHLRKRDDLKIPVKEKRIESLQTDHEQSNQSLAVKTNNFKKTVNGIDLSKGLESQVQTKLKGDASNYLLNSSRDFTSCFQQGFETEETSNDIEKKSSQEFSVHINFNMSRQINQSKSENIIDRHYKSQENFNQFKMVDSPKDISLSKSMKQQQIVCVQNPTKHMEKIRKSPSFLENIVHSVNEYSESLTVYEMKTSPDNHCLDTELTDSTKDNSSTNFTNDAKTICFDSTNVDTKIIPNSILYAKDEAQTTSAYANIPVNITGQYSDNTRTTLCYVDAVPEKVIQSKDNSITCASFEKAMQNTSSGTTDAAIQKPIQSMFIDSECAVLNKHKLDTKKNLDKTGANINIHLPDSVSEKSKSNKDVNLQVPFMYAEDTVYQKNDECDKLHDAHSLHESTKTSHIQDTNFIHSKCIVPDEISDEIISYSPLEATEATVSQDPITNTEEIKITTVVPKIYSDDSHHNTDLIDSLLCEMDWSSQIMEEENTLWCVDKPEPKINLSFLQQRIPDGTNIVKELAKEVSNLNKLLLKTKREIEAARRQWAILTSQQDKNSLYSRFHK